MNMTLILHQITVILLKKTQGCHHHCPFLFKILTPDDNAKDLSDGVVSTGASLIELHTAAYDWKKVKIDYEVPQFLFHERPVEEHFIDCNSPSFLMRKLEKTFFFKLICTYNKSKRANQYSL